MSRNQVPRQILELAFTDCYISDDRPRDVKKTADSRAIPSMSFDDDFYREPGPRSEPRITSKFKAAKLICDYAKSGPKSFRFWKLFKKLPIKLRNKIYKLLIFAWSPDAQWARLSRNGRRFSVSRRSNMARPLPPFHYLSDDPLGVTKEDLANWTESKSWEQSEGLLDFFKFNEYRNIQRLLFFIERIESGLQTERSIREAATVNKERGKQIQKKEHPQREIINLWEEIVAFFWDNVIIDFGERLRFDTLSLREVRGQINDQEAKCTTRDQHAEVKHICLHLNTISHTGNHTIHQRFSDHCEACHFSLLCRFITEHFQSVKTLLLYVSLPADSMQELISNSRYFAKDIVEAIRSLQVSDSFDLRARVLSPEFTGEEGIIKFGDIFLDNWSQKAQLWFRTLLTPRSILANQAARHENPFHN